MSVSNPDSKVEQAKKMARRNLKRLADLSCRAINVMFVTIVATLTVTLMIPIVLEILF